MIIYKVDTFKKLLKGEFVPKSELNNDNNKSKVAATTDININECLLLRNYIYGEN